jgi:hypothetical protein
MILDETIDFARKVIMPTNAVRLPVIASVPLDCVFWPENDGWTGSCEELSITVRGNSFEQAKKQMQADLQLRIASFLPRRKMAA